jgi:DNA-binding NarL/FixJ family response regulator
MSLIPMQIKITFDQTIPLYQKLAPKIKELKALGMTNIEIASKLKISRKTIQKASLVN